jgi:Ca2+-binding RTX toxin-like protein
VLSRSTTFAVTAVVTGVLLGTPTPAATASAETCQGRPATIVGTGHDIQGTTGNDVIVTGASSITLADAGDDLICVTPYPHDDLFVDAGPGDDVVDASGPTTTSVPGYRVDLGSGIDRYIGGPVHDEVQGQDFDDSVTGADTVRVEVTAPMTGQPGTYTGSHLRVRSAVQDVEIDLKGTVLVGGMLAAHISGFTRAGAVAPRAIVRGNAKENYLTAYGCDVQIIGKGGGDDLLGGSSSNVPFTACNGEATMRGGSGDDYIKGLNGRNRLIGNSGNDEIHGRLMDDLLRGGSGNDNLSSGHGSDILLGNRGRDNADGERGRDRCKAEQERRCER